MTTKDYFEVKLDAGAIVVGFNSYASAISGYAPDEVIGKNWFRIFIGPQDLVPVLKVFHETFLGQKTHWEHTNEIILKSEERILLHWGNEIILDEDGKRIYILAKGTPVTKY